MALAVRDHGYGTLDRLAIVIDDFQHFDSNESSRGTRVADALARAIEQAHATLRKIKWFQVTETRKPCGRWQGDALAAGVEDWIEGGGGLTA
jgi:hypothetical protein